MALAIMEADKPKICKVGWKAETQERANVAVLSEDYPLAEFPLGWGQSFVLPEPSVNWMRFTHIMENHLPYRKFIVLNNFLNCFK